MISLRINAISKSFKVNVQPSNTLELLKTLISPQLPFEIDTNTNFIFNGKNILKEFNDTNTLVECGIIKDDKVVNGESLYVIMGDSLSFSHMAGSTKKSKGRKGKKSKKSRR